jgi:hypothetical protein
MVSCSSAPVSRSDLHNSSDSATTLVSLAIHDAERAGWVHEEVESSGSGHTVTMSNDIGTSEGRQLINPDGAHATVVLIDGVAYMQGDSGALKNYFGLPNSVSTQLAGKWISLRPGNSEYSAVSDAVTLKSDFSKARLIGPLVKGSTSEIDGQRVIAIEGGVSHSGGGQSVPGTLYVSATGQVLPVEIRTSGQFGRVTVVWSRWGHAVQLAAPSGAVSIFSVGG